MLEIDCRATPSWILGQIPKQLQKFGCYVRPLNLSAFSRVSWVRALLVHRDYPGIFVGRTKSHYKDLGAFLFKRTETLYVVAYIDGRTGLQTSAEDLQVRYHAVENVHADLKAVRTAIAGHGTATFGRTSGRCAVESLCAELLEWQKAEVDRNTSLQMAVLRSMQNAPLWTTNNAYNSHFDEDEEDALEGTLCEESTEMLRCGSEHYA